MSTGQRAAQAGTLRGDLAPDLSVLARFACDTGRGVRRPTGPGRPRHGALRRSRGADAAKEEMWHDQANAGPVARALTPAPSADPGAQLRFEDVDGMRITAFATNTTRGQLPDLELRHRRRARCEDRIRVAKDTGLTNLPLHSFDANRIWCAVVALAAEITAWMQMLAFAGTDPGSQADTARRWEPKRLRYRIFTIAATLARTGRRTWLHLSTRSPWAALTLTGLSRLADLAPG